MAEVESRSAKAAPAKMAPASSLTFMVSQLRLKLATSGCDPLREVSAREMLVIEPLSAKSLCPTRA